MFATHPLVNYMSRYGGVLFVHRLLTVMNCYKVQQLGNLPPNLYCAILDLSASLYVFIEMHTHTHARGNAEQPFTNE